MDLFGIKGHDERHDEEDRLLRRLVEQVAQLSIDLGVTRTELRRLSLTVDGSVAEADVDPGIVALNEGVKEARIKLAEAQVAADENWAAVSDELSDAISSLREDLRASEG